MWRWSGGGAAAAAAAAAVVNAGTFSLMTISAWQIYSPEMRHGPRWHVINELALTKSPGWKANETKINIESTGKEETAITIDSSISLFGSRSFTNYNTINWYK